MAVLHKITFELCKLEVKAIHLGNDLRRPLLGKLAQFFRQADRSWFHRTVLYTRVRWSAITITANSLDLIREFIAEFPEKRSSTGCSSRKYPLRSVPACLNHTLLKNRPDRRFVTRDFAVNSLKLESFEFEFTETPGWLGTYFGPDVVFFTIWRRIRVKFRGRQSDRKILSARQIMSVWPVTGGPAVHDGRELAAGLCQEAGPAIWAQAERP